MTEDSKNYAKDGAAVADSLAKIMRQDRIDDTDAGAAASDLILIANTLLIVAEGLSPETRGVLKRIIAAVPKKWYATDRPEKKPAGGRPRRAGVPPNV
jgi:hypothetical protein